MTLQVNDSLQMKNAVQDGVLAGKEPSFAS
jgi:hypothetical protein